MEKNNTEKLQESLNELIDYVNDFFDFLPIPVCDISPTFHIVQANKAFEKATNFDLLEIVGEPIENLFLEKEKLKNVFSLLSLSPMIENQEFTIITKDKKEKIFNTFWAKRKERGYFLAMIDITALKKFHQEMEEKIKSRTQELKTKIEELEKFQKISVGRELKMIELKEKIAKLEEEIKILKEEQKNLEK